VSLFASAVAYIAAISALVAGGMTAAWVMFAPPADVAASKAHAAIPQKYAKLSEPALSKPDSSPFRYGPEINHGRSDAPVNAAAQARKEALAMAPSPGRKKISIYPTRHTQPAAMPVMSAPAGYAPSVPSTGQ
jgi:hypothetical protein